MQLLRRLLLRLTRKANPQLDRVLNEVGGTIERLAENNAFLRQIAHESRDRKDSLRAELNEALAMYGSGRWSYQPDGVIARESLPMSVRESVRDVEAQLASEDRGWAREAFGAEHQFSRWGIRLIILIARLYAIKNPTIRRGVQISADYVFGRGFEATVKDDPAASEELQRFLNDPRNSAAIGKAALRERARETWTDGNLFFACFTTPAGEVIVRMIDPLEIEEIVSNPDDATEPWFYRRTWQSQAFDPAKGEVKTEQKTAWYCALGAEVDAPEMIGGKPVARDVQGLPVRVLHSKWGGLRGWKFGCPRAFPALDWARASKELLEDYATRTRNLALFAMDIETKGGAPAIGAMSQALKSTNGESLGETNPAPAGGSTFVHGPGTKMSPIKVAGASSPPDEARRLFLMVYMCFGCPETFWSDVQTGNLATAKSLDRPTELTFLGDQESWIEILRALAAYQLEASARVPGGRLRRSIAEAATEQKRAEITVSFPPILEGDVNEEIAAISQALDHGFDKRTGVEMMMHSLGTENTEEVLDRMEQDGLFDQPDPEEEPEPAPREALAMRGVGALVRVIERLLVERKAA